MRTLLPDRDCDASLNRGYTVMALQTLKRLSRYAGVAHQAYRIRRSDEEAIRQQARRHLVQKLGRLRGLPQKLGQMLSFSEAALTDDPQAEHPYSSLQEQAEPLPLSVVQPLMETAWGRRIEDVLSWIDPHAAAASLGQVHRATTRDGEEVAVKVQYPGMHEALAADLKMLGWLSLPVGNLRRGFDMSGYRQVILDDLEKELDYRGEAHSQREFHRWAAEGSFLVVPHVIDELSTDQVLVTQWMEGDHWNDVRKNWTSGDKRKLAAGLLKFFFEGLFLRGAMHADWHPGNLRFLRGPGGPQLLLYDFGCIHRPTDEQRLALLRLIRATIDGTGSPYPLFIKLGFDAQYLEPLAHKLPALCRALFAPLVADYPFEMADWRLSERIADILGDDRWNFRIAGPSDLMLLLRAFHGLKYYLSGLAAAVPWRRAIAPCLDHLAVDMAQMETSPAEEQHADFSSLATRMKIRVTQNGSTKVELTVRAEAIDDLDELLPDDVRERISVRGINLGHVTADVRRRGYSPGPVFEIEEQQKRVAVWLE